MTAATVLLMRFLAVIPLDTSHYEITSPPHTSNAGSEEERKISETH